MKHWKKWNFQFRNLKNILIGNYIANNYTKINMKNDLEHLVHGGEKTFYNAFFVSLIALLAIITLIIILLIK